MTRVKRLRGLEAIMRDMLYYDNSCAKIKGEWYSEQEKERVEANEDVARKIEETRECIRWFYEYFDLRLYKH